MQRIHPRLEIPYTYTVRRYAITDRALFPDQVRAPHLPPPEHGASSETSQLAALIRQTALWAAQGIEYIQLREKDLPAATLATLTRQILQVLHNSRTKLLINSRLDIAVATAAHGVHLISAPGQLTPAQVRSLYATARLPPPIVSISCHTLAEVEAARNHADLILFSPIFEKSAAGKLTTPGQGLEALRRAASAASPTPVYALGGVTPQNAPSCLETGASGIAGIRLFHQ